MEETASHVLVSRAKQKDPQAVAELYERYRDRLRTALRRVLGEQYRRATLMDSEDAVQDAILMALQSLEQFEYRGSGSFLGWVLRVAQRQVLQKLRAQNTQKRARQREVPLENAMGAEALDASPSEVAQANETEQRIWSCLETMTEAEREVLVLRRYFAMTTSEIRAEMQLSSEGAVRATLSRAQARLAACLDRAS